MGARTGQRKEGIGGDEGEAAKAHQTAGERQLQTKEELPLRPNPLTCCCCTPRAALTHRVKSPDCSMN